MLELIQFIDKARTDKDQLSYSETLSIKLKEVGHDYGTPRTCCGLIKDYYTPECVT